VEEHDLMMAAECASALRVSKMSIYRLIRAGHLEAVRIGRHYRVKRASFQAFMAGGGVGE
jgi:excisionase family DNA binding protein